MSMKETDIFEERLDLMIVEIQKCQEEKTVVEENT